MRQKHFSIAAVSLLLVAGMITFVSLCSPVQAMCDHQATPTESGITQLAPRYFEYSQEAYTEAQKTGNNVLLYFWAPWCSTCAALDNDIAKDPEIIPQDVIILRIPYDTASALKAQYNIVTQHTFVQVDGQGNPLQVWVGGEPGDIRKKL